MQSIAYLTEKTKKKKLCKSIAKENCICYNDNSCNYAI